MKHTHIKTLSPAEQKQLDEWLSKNTVTVIPKGVKALTRKGKIKDESSNV